MKLLDRVKKTKENKGFTLVELIVVLVILAILAAILVPALLGYIDKARNQQDVLNAKSCLTASQAKLSELYANPKFTLSTTTLAAGTAEAEDILAMADANVGSLQIGTKAVTLSATSTVQDRHDAYTVIYVKYVSADTGAQPIYFNGSSWTDVATEALTDNITVYTIK